MMNQKQILLFLKKMIKIMQIFGENTILKMQNYKFYVRIVIYEKVKNKKLIFKYYFVFKNLNNEKTFYLKREW